MEKEGPILVPLPRPSHTEFLTRWNGFAPRSAPHLTLLTTLGKAPPCQGFYILGFNNDDNNLLST